jgi:hypothetical protein
MRGREFGFFNEEDAMIVKPLPPREAAPPVWILPLIGSTPTRPRRLA